MFLEVLKIDLIVFFPTPHKFVALFDNVDIFEPHGNECKDCYFNETKVNQFVVTISRDLTQDGVTNTRFDLGKAMLAEKTQRFRCLRVHFID